MRGGWARSGEGSAWLSFPPVRAVAPALLGSFRVSGVTGMFESFHIFNKTTAGFRGFAFPALPSLGSSCQAGDCLLNNKFAAKIKKSGQRKPLSVCTIHFSALQCPFQPCLHPFHLASLSTGSPRLTSLGVGDAQWVVPVVRASKCTWHFRQPRKAILSGTAPSPPALHG